MQLSNYVKSVEGRYKLLKCNTTCIVFQKGVSMASAHQHSRRFKNVFLTENTVPLQKTTFFSYRHCLFINFRYDFLSHEFFSLTVLILN